jgi:CRISPR-associated protein Cas1
MTMKRFLNTLYVSTQKTYLSKDGECIRVEAEGREVTKIPVHILDGVVCFGNVTCSPFLLGHCAENGVAVSFLTEYGRFLGTVHGAVSGNVLLRRRQYRLTDGPEAAGIARSFLIGKIVNCRTLLRRSAREREDEADALGRAADRLSGCLAALPEQPDIDALRGIEGEAAAIYFGVLDRMIGPDRDGFRFKGRNRRPPLDPTNCLLSFLYTLLVHDIRSALETVGLDPAVGFLHRDRPGRPSLALDMMEEFRPYMVDRLVLTLINRRQIEEGDFLFRPGGAVVLIDAARKKIIAAWQERKRDEILHPFIGKQMPVGLLWHMQARLLAKHIRGELDAYPPFTVR